MTIKVHHLRPAPGAKTAKTRVGRGDGSKGKTAGRGTKGTGARKNVPAAFEGGNLPLHMRLPKLKGFRNRFKVTYQVVNVGQIAALFPAGGAVGGDELVASGGEQRRDLTDVDHLIGDLEAVPESLELGQPHVQRQVPALERRGDVLAGAGALGAATGGLALGAVATTDAGLGRLRARGRAQVMNLNRHCRSLPCR